jgi:hypothetical protein
MKWDKHVYMGNVMNMAANDLVRTKECVEEADDEALIISCLIKSCTFATSDL